MITLTSADGATAEIHRQGAHVTSWRPSSDGAERLFLSERTERRTGAALRGGIPVIFPQFAAEGPLPRHGFARTSEWTLVSTGRAPDGDAVADFLLADTAATQAIWPFRFHAELSVRIGGERLQVTLMVRNTGDEPLTFTAALHTYLRVQDVKQVQLVGLHGARYRLPGHPHELSADSGEALTVTDAIDRVYVNAPRQLTLREPDRVMRIGAAGFPDVVVWNPGAAAAALPDMEPHGERRMLCVEAAAVQRPVTLDPTMRWTGSQTLVAGHE